MRAARRPKKVNIEPNIEALVRYLEAQNDILAAYLYGSYGTAHQTVLSDIDITLLFYRERRPDLRRLLSLEADIASICGEDDVNVLVLNDADVILQHRVLETGRVLVEKEPAAVSDFRERVFVIYGDFEPFYRAFCRDYDRVLREAFVCDRPRQGEGQDKLSQTQSGASSPTGKDSNPGLHGKVSGVPCGSPSATDLH
ncbi:MAG: hypothetical protein IMF26_03595 [Candidatus Fermentithermobacillus carboniphilus]|uniref:Polymerase beta nucleotidyltransferase domain-containing protein n=1 Tax=Candidatus Fermentithermobacillus carboniphilus TaxID=3085328 RepID=A0AAT9LDR7_9FIRM|nr:MAG: hypothetical protein IMF26_03595 [Candidatus Fermentithermobacillus carboniphilus]